MRENTHIILYTEVHIYQFSSVAQLSLFATPWTATCQASLSSVQFSCSVVSDSLQPHRMQHTRLPCPSPTPGVCSNFCPLSWRCHSAISSSVFPFSYCLQSFPTSRSFLVSQIFTLDGQSVGVSASASILPMNTQN